MRTTVTLDDGLVERAAEVTGIEGRSALLERALRELIAREAARRLALLGGSDPGAVSAPRPREGQGGAGPAGA